MQNSSDPVATCEEITIEPKVAPSTPFSTRIIMPRFKVRTWTKTALIGHLLSAVVCSVTWALNGSEAGINKPFFLSHVNAN